MNRDQWNKQQRLETQVNRNVQTIYQKEVITNSGIDSMFPSPAPLYIDNTVVGVAVGGEVGGGQEYDRLAQIRISKGKVKWMNRGLLLMLIKNLLIKSI